MKTQILQWDEQDDLISFRDKMAWVKAPRILLTWPDEKQVAIRVVDLKLLQRHASGLGAQLGLVTQHNHLRHAAESLGIPVFESTLESQTKTWPEPSIKRKIQPKRSTGNLRQLLQDIRQLEAPWQKSAPVRWLSFSLAALSLLVLAAAFFPSAEITLFPEVRLQELTIPVTAREDAQEVYLSGIVPMQSLSLLVKGEQISAASGSVLVPSTKAKGIVVFRNLTENDLEIPKGTVVRTAESESIRFETIEGGILSGGVGHSINISVLALQPGSAGNVDAGRIQVVEGGLNLIVAVENLVPTTSGMDILAKAPDEGDRLLLYESLQGELTAAALTQAQDILGETSFVFPDTLTIVEVVNADYTPAAGEPGDELELTLEMIYAFNYVAANALTQLADQALDVSLPDGFVPIPGSTSASLMGEAELDSDGVLRFDLNVMRSLQPDFPKSMITSLIRGHVPAKAIRNLSASMPLGSSSQIQLHPSWWPWLPLFTFRIAINLVHD